MKSAMQMLGISKNPTFVRPKDINSIIHDVNLSLLASKYYREGQNSLYYSEVGQTGILLIQYPDGGITTYNAELKNWAEISGIYQNPHKNAPNIAE